MIRLRSPDPYAPRERERENSKEQREEIINKCYHLLEKGDFWAYQECISDLSEEQNTCEDD